jgi:hypothetical protein
MPSPSSALSTLRPDLAASFEAFDLEADRANYIGHRVAPVLEVASQSGNFGKIPLDQLLQQRDTVRAPGSGYSRGKFTFTPTTYACIENGAEEPIDDREENMYANYFDAELIASQRAYNAVLRNAEQRWAAAIFNTTTWTGASLTTDISALPWATLATALPLTDVEAAVQKVYDNSGLWPNALVINRKVFRNLRNATQIIDRVKYSGYMDTRAGNISIDAIGQAFDLNIIVAGGSKNSAIEGQTATPAQIWSSTYAMVCRVAMSNDPREPCIARTFHWAGDGSDADGRIESYRDEPVRSDVIRVRHDVAELVMYAQAGHLLKIA